LDGAFAEFLVYDDILTTAEQALVQNYLLDKYFLGSASIAVASAVPEPVSVLLLGLGSLIVLGNRRKMGGSVSLLRRVTNRIDERGPLRKTPCRNSNEFDGR